MTKKHLKEVLILDELTKTPNVSMACAKVGISRQTFYRWMKDRSFRQLAFQAMCYGERYVNDMAESAAMKKMQEGHWPAIKYRLDKKSSKYQFAVPESSYPTPRMISESEDLWDELEELEDDVDN